MTRGAYTCLYLPVVLCFCICTMSVSSAWAVDLNVIVQQAKEHCEKVHVDSSTNEATCKQGVDKAVTFINVCKQSPEECAFNDQGRPTDGGYLLTQRCDILPIKGTRAQGGLAVPEAPEWYGCTNLMDLYSAP